jgi:hypothetical protein
MGSTATSYVIPGHREAMRHVLGLAGDDDVLCELHGDEVTASCADGL